MCLLAGTVRRFDSTNQKVSVRKRLSLSRVYTVHTIFLLMQIDQPKHVHMISECTALGVYLTLRSSFPLKLNYLCL